LEPHETVPDPGWVATAVEIVTSAEDLIEDYDPLTQEDVRYDPDYDPPGMPQVPANCIGLDGWPAGDGKCEECYRVAQDELRFLRFYLEKLRAITSATIDMSENAVKFADSTSSVHGLWALAWQLEGKPQVEEAVKKLRETYDQKYRAYMKTLQRTLKHIDSCEAKYFNNQDWYNRYGFIYYSFIEARYASPD
jgi:hypothetical protein